MLQSLSASGSASIGASKLQAEVLGLQIETMLQQKQNELDAIFAEKYEVIVELQHQEEKLENLQEDEQNFAGSALQVALANPDSAMLRRLALSAMVRTMQISAMTNDG